MKAILFIIFLVLTKVVCSQEEILTMRQLKLEDFENTIKPTMGYDTLIAKYGYPSERTGSGLDILIYTLIDSTTIVIGCYSMGTVYAKYFDKNGLMLDLIPNTSSDHSSNKRRIKRSKNPPFSLHCFQRLELEHLDSDVTPAVDRNAFIKNQVLHPIYRRVVINHCSGFSFSKFKTKCYLEERIQNNEECICK